MSSVEEMLSEPITKKVRKNLDLIDRFGRVIVQNYYSGAVRSMREASAGRSCAPTEVSYLGEKQILPQTWRKLVGEEAAQLWKIQVYADYYLSMGVDAQGRYEDALRQLVGQPKPSDEELSIMPEGTRQAMQGVLRVIGERDRAAGDMKKYSGQDIRRTSEDQWVRGRVRPGLAAQLIEHLRGIAEKARVQRDIEHSRLINAKIIAVERVKQIAKQQVLDEIKPRRKYTKKEVVTDG